jgi:hypothetical protein
MIRQRSAEAPIEAGGGYGNGTNDQMARYSLIVSIRAPDIDVDLYSAVATKIGTPVEVQV